MQCEADERERNNSDDDEDPFIAEGLSSDSDSDNENLVAYRTRVLQGPVSGLRLRQARARRDQLKRRLFRAKERRQRQRQRGSDYEMEGQLE
jgi:hypothetical protein